MTTLKKYFPANRLADALSRARPMSVDQCIKQADENLRHIAIACADHVDVTLGLLEETVVGWPARPDRAYIDSIYQLSLRLIGASTTAGLPRLDNAASSLCRLVDAGAEVGHLDRAAVEIHIKSMRLLRSKATPDAVGDVILRELGKVLLKFSSAGNGATPGSA